MSLFGFRKKKENKPDPGYAPYKQDALNHVYNMLFCDRKELYQPQDESIAGQYPWNLLFAERADTSGLEEILHDTSLEARLRALAANSLRAAGAQVAGKTLFGIVIEVGLDGGLDVLASYADGSARYINHSGKMIIWDARDEASDQLTSQLFQAGQTVVGAIGPHDGPRWAFPQKNHARLSFLVSDELYFGQSTIDHFFKDPMAGPVLHAGTQLMQYLIQKGR